MLEKFFISKVRVKLLKLFLFNPTESYHVRGITRELDEEINAVRRELERMAKVKFVKSERKGNRLYYSLRKDFPLFQELLALVNKEYGLGKEIISGAKEIGDIKFAWLTRFYIKQLPKGNMDVDLVVVGDNVNLDKLAQHAKAAEKDTEKQINYTVMSPHEFEVRKQRRDNFVMNLLLSSRVMLIGDEDEMFL